MFKDFANVWMTVGVARDRKRDAGVSCAFIDRSPPFVRCSIFGLDPLNGSRRSGIYIAAPDCREAAGR
ncbi:hypothetical protein HUN39_07240 [Methylocystis sp. FS]|uniref:hypothetical protein n=1 Tax=Methylocystis TaxID=133 RepID=UPI0015824911|nr:MULTISPECIES: hypothetical protein [Methylocystis]MBG0801456.1 hypothetical protein [Methylocystis sp. H4A]MBG0802046.1 hypothetical protein [Methylocystis sp. H4A]NUJ79826.1 hypothetical protein [Methylocystis silviterrae]